MGTSESVKSQTSSEQQQSSSSQWNEQFQALKNEFSSLKQDLPVQTSPQVTQRMRKIEGLIEEIHTQVSSQSGQSY